MDECRGRHLVFYVIFISIYIVTVILQRNPRDSQTMQQAMQTHLAETTYVDPYSFELKGFKDTATVDDMWHWLQVFPVLAHAFALLLGDSRKHTF
jgi:cytochrome b561